MLAGDGEYTRGLGVQINLGNMEDKALVYCQDSPVVYQRFENKVSIVLL